MKIRVPEYFKRFACIASECTDSCCAGWEVDLDEEAYKWYMETPGPFGDRLRDSIIVDEEGIRFRLINKDCPYLNKEKLCDIYIAIGEDKLCKTCTEFPRFQEEYGSLRERGISLSCPEAARLILYPSDKITFELTENDEMVSHYNDIDPQVYFHLISARKEIFAVLQNRDYDIETRIKAALLYTKDVQKKLGNMNSTKPMEEYLSKAMQCKKGDRIEYLRKYLEFSDTLENINKEWKVRIHHLLDNLEVCEENREAFMEYHKEWEYEYEHLMVYFVYRYFLKAAFDKKALSKLKIGVVSYILLRELGIDRWLMDDREFTPAAQVDLMQMYSKEIEHSDYNMDTLWQQFEKNKMYSIEKLTGVLS